MSKPALNDEPRCRVSGKEAGPITVVALCGVAIDHDSIRINRKFHTGMCEYVQRLPVPINCVLPRMSSEAARNTMDLIELSRHQLPYRISTVSDRTPRNEELEALAPIVKESSLIYCGSAGELNLKIAELARQHGVPYIVTTECTLSTQLDIMRAETTSRVRQWLRARRIRRGYERERVLVRHAAEVHANGYPTYEEHSSTNSIRTLYFDTRVVHSDLISNAELERRLLDFRTGHRPARLLFSGRYVHIKGVEDLVLTALMMKKTGVRFELDLYGSGPLRDRLRELVRADGAEGCIRINDAVPFSPDLIEIARKSDLFCCCHPQGDPSCTYLETLACGVPIVGYANEMWTPLCAASKAGVVVDRGDRKAMSSAIEGLLRNVDKLGELSRRARAFAADNTMEHAWQKRCNRMMEVIQQNARRA